MSNQPGERDIERDAADLSTQRNGLPERPASDKDIIDEEDDAKEGDNDGNPRAMFDELVKAAKDELIHEDETSKNEKILNLATLQRMVLFHLQTKIIEQTGKLVKRRLQGGNPLDQLQKDLATYTQAVRDWEQMAKSQAEAGHNRTLDPFCISTKSVLAKQAMDSAGILAQAGGNYTKGNLETQVGSFRQRMRMRKDRNFKALMARFAMAIFGGVALIGPMLLMVLHKDRTTDLSTTSVATFLFAGVVAWFSTATPETIVGVVAAYTAVLVVFVGTLQ